MPVCTWGRACTRGTEGKLIDPIIQKMSGCFAKAAACAGSVLGAGMQLSHAQTQSCLVSFHARGDTNQWSRTRQGVLLTLVSSG